MAYTAEPLWSHKSKGASQFVIFKHITCWAEPMRDQVLTKAYEETLKHLSKKQANYSVTSGKSIEEEASMFRIILSNYHNIRENVPRPH